MADRDKSASLEDGCGHREFQQDGRHKYSENMTQQLEIPLINRLWEEKNNKNCHFRGNGHLGG